MTHDLKAALREARGLCKRARMLPVSIGVEQLLTRIDAALSAASGDIPICVCYGHPAVGTCQGSAEAPNVERARNLANSLKSIVPPPQSVVDKIEAALDSARAEGIATERERCAEIAAVYRLGGHIESMRTANAIGDSIQGVKSC